MRTWVLIALLPLAAQAQLTMNAVNGTTETAVTSTYQFGQVPLNTTLSVQFQIYNTGSAAVSVNIATLSGTGFTFEYPPVIPYPIPPNSAAAENIWVSFTPTSTASFSASLQVGSLSVILLGSGVTAPTLTSAAGCSGNFGNVPLGSTTTCTFTLANLNPQAITVTAIAVNGLGFSGPNGVTAPLNLQAGQSASFSVSFTPPAAINYSGTLTIGTQSYALSGTGQPPPLPTPSLQFDSGAFSSGQQRVLTMTLPSPATIAATGYVSLTFTPSTPVVADDSEIVFLANGARTVPFSVSAGATKALLNGQGSATFQTGTTEGTITFTITSPQLSGSPTAPPMVAIPGASVIVDSTSASKERPGFLDVTITGADNTYSAGAMSFSFFDTSGNAMDSASANFATAFKSYYATVNKSGSSFIALVTFPVNGSAANIGSVAVILTNAAGVTNTGPLTFQ